MGSEHFRSVMEKLIFSHKTGKCVCIICNVFVSVKSIMLKDTEKLKKSPTLCKLSQLAKADNIQENASIASYQAAQFIAQQGKTLLKC